MCHAAMNGINLNKSINTHLFVSTDADSLASEEQTEGNQISQSEPKQLSSELKLRHLEYEAVFSEPVCFCVLSLFNEMLYIDCFCHFLTDGNIFSIISPKCS